MRCREIFNPLVIRILSVLLVLSAFAEPFPGHTASAQSDVSFSISPDVSDEDASYVREGIALARRYSETLGGGKSQKPLFVNVRDTSYSSEPGVIGFSSDGFITIFSGSVGWNSMTAQRRVQVVVHEYIHAVEFTWLLGVEQEAPQWFIEGLSEYFSHDALVQEGLLTQTDVRDYYTWTVTNFVDVPPLEDLEEYLAFYRTQGSYELAYLAIDHLVGDGSTEGITRLLDELEAGTRWERAFERAFGQDVYAFYNSFAEARTEMYAPSEIPDAFRESDPQYLESPVRIKTIPEQVRPGEQLVVIGKAQPNASCVFSLSRTTNVAIVVGSTFADQAGQIFWLLTIPDDLESGWATVALVCGADPVSAEISVIRP